jgi:leucyl aminopeptidase
MTPATPATPNTPQALSQLLIAASDTPYAALLQILTPEDAASWLSAQAPALQSQLAAQRFRAQRGEFAVQFDAGGRVSQALIALSAEQPYPLATLAHGLPPGDYALPDALSPTEQERLAVAFAIGAYQFTRYKPKVRKAAARLVVPHAGARASAQRMVEAMALARDCVNTPTEDFGPDQLAQAVQQLAERNQARFQEIAGEALLQENFPAIHAVGRASHRAPRLLQLSHGEAKHPRIAIIGKGVCFDTGGLDMKASDGMAWMKKDMGGAAVALALAQLVIESGLKVQLQLLIPAVENAIGPNAYRPGEIIRTRAGLSVEIGNTDAEGRVILCDALSFAAESKPELMLNFATLTGAARIALGPDLPATFSNSDALRADLLAAGEAAQDPLWPMPLWADYQRYLDSPIADMNNAGSTRMAGAITAALYLQRFVPANIPWAHIDTYCWNDADRPGRPKGGECQSLRAAYVYLQRRYGA